MTFKKLFTALVLSASVATLSAAPPRYVFYCIGDGMGVGQAMAGQTYNSVSLGNEDPLLMMQFPTAGMVETWSANRRVTDSAAAGTALATGKKTRNGMVGVTPDSVPAISIATTLHDRGWGVALLTTVAPDDATPAAFYAHVPYRRMYYDIGRQAAESGFEFIAGSDWRGVKDSKTGETTDLHDYIRSHGIDLVTSTKAARESSSRRVFLYGDTLFYSNNAGYVIDSIPGALTLPDMTATAIEHMKRVSPDHFFMMVEGGNIDHVAHGNDGGGVAVEVYNFNDALKPVYDFYLEHPDETIIIVTADHETGGMAIGSKSNGYKSYFQNIPRQRLSKEMFTHRVGEMLSNPDSVPTWKEFKDFTKRHTGLWHGVRVTDEQEATLHELYDKTFTLREQLAETETLYATFDALSNEVFSILNENIGFSWSTWGHSGNPVPLYAIGEGTEIFSSLNDNTDIAPKILKLIDRE